MDVVVCRLFLRLDGYNLAAAKGDRYQTFLRLASGDLSEDELAS